MATLLEKWKNKKSWNRTWPVVYVYMSKATGEKDLSLSALCSKEKTLTLNPKSGFEEIAIVPAEINPCYKFITEELPKFSYSLEKTAEMLIVEIKKYLLELWDSNRFHLAFCSAGMDSRTVAWVLSDLRREMGKDWIGDIHFRCHEQEGPLFKRFMKMQGWEKSQYSVYKEGRHDELDYFRIGDFNEDGNAFRRPPIMFWDDLITREEAKNLVLVSGLGGNMLSYSIAPDFPENRFKGVWGRLSRAVSIDLLYYYNKWGDFLAPQYGYDFLNLAFRIPTQLFHMITLETDSYPRDALRGEILKHFKDDVPIFHRHRYNLKISHARAEYMKKMYLGSKFYGDFKHLSFVRDAKPWEVYLRGNVPEIVASLDAKLYGYAAMYQHVQRN